MAIRSSLIFFSLLVVISQAQDAPVPVVIWHGMGDSCCNPASMGRIKQFIEDETGGLVISLKIGLTVIDDTINGFLKPVNKQVEQVCAELADNPDLKNGYNAVGFSQGGQFLRAVAQRCPNPPMKNLVTIAGQHQGVFGIPGCPGESQQLCNIMRELLYLGAYNELVQSILVQAQYWHDPVHADQYIEKSQFIGEINNEGPNKNASYAENLNKLENFVMVMNTEDTTVEPKESAHFEFYVPGQDNEILPLRESQLYLEDWIGLKTMDEAGKLHFYDIPGGHLQLSLEWFKTEIIQKFFM